MTTRTITLEECSKHTTEDSCWLVIHGKVYDVTKFLDEHPGGYDIIITNTGTGIHVRCFMSRNLAV